MAEAISVSAPITGSDKSLTFETGKLAPQSQGAVVARLGDTVLLATANAAKGAREGIDFFPLTVDVEERMYAAGRIPGSFFRREGRPSDVAILNARLIDRTLRPLFADGFRNETQVVVHILGADQSNPPDVLGINAASAALMLSGIPFNGPVGAVRLAYSAEGEWVPNPTFAEGDEGTFEMVVTGRETGDGAIAIMMVEAGGTEKAWDAYESGAPKVTEEVVAAGIEASKTWIKESIDLQRRLVEQAGARAGDHWEPVLDYSDEILDRVAEVGRDRLAEASRISLKAERNAAIDSTTAALLGELSSEFPDADKKILSAVRAMTKKLVRQRIVEEGQRIDGRGPRRPPAAVGRGRRAPHGPRVRAVPAGRDPGAQRLHAGHAEDGPAARQPGAGREEALHAPLQHAARSPTARSGAWAAPSGVRSAMGSSPSGRCCRSCRRPTSSPTPSGWCPRSCRPTARPRWPRCARRRCR